MIRKHASLAVVRNGQGVNAQGYGLANVELNVVATPETIDRLLTHTSGISGRPA